MTRETARGLKRAARRRNSSTSAFAAEAIAAYLGIEN